MDPKEFKKLLDEGQIGEILSEGGANLTKEQMNLVKEKSKELSADILMQKKMQLATQPGYKESIIVPLKVKLLTELFKEEKKKEGETEQPKSKDNFLPEKKPEQNKEDLPKFQLDKNKITTVASLKTVAKMGMSFKTISQEFKKINKGFSNLVKMEGGKPSEPGILGKDVADARANQQLFVRLPKKKDEKEKEKESGFSFSKILDLLVNGLMVLIGGAIIAVSDIGTFVSNTYDKIKTGFINLKDFVINLDWYEYFKTASVEFLHLISLGFIDRETASNIFDRVGSGTKAIVEGIGSFLTSAKKILIEETSSFKNWLALDVFKIDVREVETRGNRKERDEYIERLKQDGLKLDDEIKELSTKKEGLIRKRRTGTTTTPSTAPTPSTNPIVTPRPVTATNAATLEQAQGKTTAVAPTPSAAAQTTAPPPTPPAATNAATLAQAQGKTTAPSKELERTATSGDSNVQYPTVKGQAVVTSRFGKRQLKRRDGSFDTRLHPGIDYAGVPEGTPIQILTDAEVYFAGQMSSISNGYGNMIELVLKNGEALRFGHLKDMFVKKGDKLESGKVIATMGNTGESYGAHLHFEHLSQPWKFVRQTQPPHFLYDPLKTGAGKLIAMGNKPVRLVADQRYDAFRGDEGLGLDASSSKIAQLYREQGRVSNPVIVNNTRVNNMVVGSS